MKILVTAYDFPPQLGGVSNCAQQLVESLRDIPGVDLRVICPIFQTDSEEVVAPQYLKRISLSKNTWLTMPKLAYAIRREVLDWKPDAILNMLWFPCGLATYFALNSLKAAQRPPYFSITHGMELMESSRTLKKRIRKHLAFLKHSYFRNSKRIMAVSDHTRQLVSSEGRVPLSKISVCLNGVDPKKFLPGIPNQALAKFYDLRGRFTFLTLARLIPSKGIDKTIEAMGQLKQHGIEAIYLIAGDGPDKPRLKKLVADLKLVDNVHFIGRIRDEELSDHYNLADCFILLSREDPIAPQTEGFGLVFLEAGACEIPSIGGKSGGISNAILDKQTGWLVNPNKVEDLTQQMFDCISNREKIKLLGKNARKRILSELTWDHMAERVYKEIGTTLEKNKSEFKKICFYSTATQLGGAEKSLLELITSIKHSKDDRYRLNALMPRHMGTLVTALEANEIQHETLLMPQTLLRLSRSRGCLRLPLLLLAIFPSLLYFMRLCLWIQKNRPTLIHSNGIKCHVFSYFASILTGTPIIWHFRDILPEGPLKWFFRMAPKLHSVTLITNSEATLASLYKKQKDRPKGSSVVYNGISPALYSKNRNSIYRTRFHIAPNHKMVGIIGALANWKGQLQFVEMAHILVQKNEALDFLIIGDEIYDTMAETGIRSKVELLIKQLGLRSRVHMTGFELNPEIALNSLDILVHASLRPEPFGRVILEAMATEVPIVASAAGGVLELVQNEVNGLLFEPGNVKEMAKQVQRLNSDPQLCRQLTDSAYNRFINGFTLKNHVEKVLKLYEATGL